MPLKQIPYLMIKSATTIHKEEKTLRKKKRKQSKFVDIVKQKVTHASCSKAWNAICNLCSKKGHFEKVFESINVNEHPNTMVTKKINCQWLHGKRHRRRSQHHFRKDIPRAPFSSSPETMWNKTQNIQFDAVALHRTTRSDHLHQREADQNHHTCF